MPIKGAGYRTGIELMKGVTDGVARLTFTYDGDDDEYLREVVEAMTTATAMMVRL